MAAIIFASGNWAVQTSDLNGHYITKVLSCKTKGSYAEFYRYIRLQQTGKNACGRDYLTLVNIEFFEVMANVANAWIVNDRKICSWAFSAVTWPTLIGSAILSVGVNSSEYWKIHDAGNPGRAVRAAHGGSDAAVHERNRYGKLQWDRLSNRADIGSG
jgi:hypothetical protein